MKMAFIRIYAIFFSNRFSQLRYNDELMYDVSLKMETDRNNEFDSDRRRHRK